MASSSSPSEHTPPSSSSTPQVYSPSSSPSLSSLHLPDPIGAFIKSIEGREITLPDQSRWQVCETLKSFRELDIFGPNEGCIVCACEKLADSDTTSYPMEAVMKIKIQIPGDYARVAKHQNIIKCLQRLEPKSQTTLTELKEEWEELCLLTKPTMTPNPITQEEIDALTQLTEQGCEVTPKLLGALYERQHHADPMPGGYVLYLLMSKLPGYNLQYTFPEMPLEEREAVRRQLLSHLNRLRACGVEHNDPGRRNLMWDEETRKLMIIDFETAHTGQPGEVGDIVPDHIPKGFSTREDEFLWKTWGLDEPPVVYRYYGFD